MKLGRFKRDDTVGTASRMAGCHLEEALDKERELQTSATDKVVRAARDSGTERIKTDIIFCSNAAQSRTSALVIQHRKHRVWAGLIFDIMGRVLEKPSQSQLITFDHR